MEVKNMLFNLYDECGEIETFTRYNGGWLKKVTGLDKSKTNGYSILGEFVKGGDYKMDYPTGIYLDCSKGGSRKNQEFNYHLFKVDKDGFHLLQTMEDGGRNWACEFWEKIEEELLNSSDDKVSSDFLVNQIFEQTRDKEILKEVVKRLDKVANPDKDQEYEFYPSYLTATLDDLRGFLKVSGLMEISDKALENHKEMAIEKINALDGDEIPTDRWDKELLISELYCIIGAGFDMNRCNYTQTWLQDICNFCMGYFYVRERDVILISNNLTEVAFARINMRKY